MLKSFVLSLRFEQHRARRKRLCYWELSAILTVISNPPPQEAVAFDFPGQRAKSDFVRRVQRLNLFTGQTHSCTDQLAYSSHPLCSRTRGVHTNFHLPRKE